MKQQNNNKKTLARNKPKANSGVIVPQSQQSYAAYSYECQLKYIDEQIAKNNAGQQYIYWRIRMGDLFDPNPLILTGAISGFQELAAIYRRYIVHVFEAIVTIVNNETFPVLVTVAPSDIDLALIITSEAAAANMGEFPRAQTRLLGGSNGMNRATFRFKLNLPVFVGQEGAYEDSLQYSALVNASPAVQTFFNVSAAAPVNFVNGLTQHAQYKFRCKFSQRQTPNN